MLLQKRPPRAAVTVAESAAPEGLERIRTPGCAAAIWQRRPDPLFHQWLDRLPADRLPALRAELAVPEVGDAVVRACAASGLADGAGRTRLCRDIADLARRFSRLMHSPLLRLRLDVIGDDACRRFHLDNVPARLLCTYRGNGTEYGPAGPGSRPEPVFRMARGAVGVFRGQRWPGAEPCGLLHRSPPVARTDDTRLLLVIDLAEGVGG
ncbi:DUF1826 domain-containing protein [Pseudodonghicola flavimaris]|uniref:DUF1826 domain-containing protein n=1 Tax=Pseudodonghicola flavimaris TaxID=3050036 RepID=A0ABT7F4Y8_9RHOB|nr:DUF1826 domain-containing protein [Pseudodonghicola flavimaris]MDK3019665.1 DUF1826 domain-containing protein [Pseudodonghicola flavimaris]